ncbi:hypothetical protein [Bradyrhizobium sp. 27S5]|uniref:hypothetical protein n=1 Tax=Bradyrhizobium sp. 27S5 TaxID=3139728 RepID=UPI0030D16E80
MRKWWIVWPLYAGLMGFALGACFFFGMYGRNVTEGTIAAQHEHEAANEAAKSKKEEADEALANYTLWLMVFTGVLAFATVGLGIATMFLYATGEKQFRFAIRSGVRQFRDMQASIGISRKSANAATASVEHAEKTAQLQLRAYIGVSEVRIYHANGEWQPNIQISYRNYGQTPAHALGSGVNYFFHFRGEPSFWPVKIGQRPLYLAPSQEKTISILIPQFQWEPHKEALAKKSVGFFIFGEIHYIDVFGEDRWTKFRLQLDPDEDGIKEDGFIFCAEGNDAN